MGRRRSPRASQGSRRRPSEVSELILWRSGSPSRRWKRGATPHQLGMTWIATSCTAAKTGFLVDHEWAGGRKPGTTQVKIVVIGGAGLIGSKVVALLRLRGHDVM